MSETQTNNRYKATFILDTRGYEEPIETLIEKLKSTLTAIDCVVEKVENLGQKEFARVTDKKFPAGIYVQIDFSGPGDPNKLLNERLKLDRTINRIFVESI